MAYLRRKYYYKEKDMPQGLKSVYAGYDNLQANPLFSQLDGTIITRGSHLSSKDSIACVTKNGDIFLNMQANLDAHEWAYVIAHNLLHLAFGHFDKDKMPPDADKHPLVWNKACDIYVTRFLSDIGFGKNLFQDPANTYSIKLNDEVKIYEFLLKSEGTLPRQTYGLNETTSVDMIGIEAPIIYKNGEKMNMLRHFHLLSRGPSKGLLVMLVDTIMTKRKIH